VQQEDADWLETAAREFAEETGGLVCDHHSGRCRRWPWARATKSCGLLPSAG
jgi:hypothetical protein